jgi:hypothetical protein
MSFFDVLEYYGDEDPLDAWLELHGFMPNEEVSGEIFESMPTEIQTLYEMHHGIAEDASGNATFIPAKRKQAKQ